MLVDQNGRPISSITVEQLSRAVQGDMQNIFNILQVHQKGLMMSEMKVNFLINKLKLANLLDENTLESEWRDFVLNQQEELRRQSEAQEISIVQPNQIDLDI